ncbi:uncharacterized protein LOC119981315 [Tripterygium wilfordii]|uniref:uncharacterized protein LOC119981315 n=1 Tax=Tripterygium wilfordii TaxID=458696 RepID=UPI0018F8149D|nr:uncharacterized protein LOC119981315 [Tripterygium wilfordii]
MVRKGYEQAKSGFQLLKTLSADKYLRKIGFGKEDRYFWKQVGKALLCTYTIFGAAWVYNETSPLGWFEMTPARSPEERKLAHLYERIEYPYPGDAEAMDEFIAKGGTIGTKIGPKGTIQTDMDRSNFRKKLQEDKFEREAQKLWLRMRNEVIQELQEKGYDVE